MAAHTEERWESERISALLEAGKNATSRSRSVFVVTNVATVLLISAQFNTYFASVKQLGHKLSQPPGDHSESVKKAIDALTDFMWKELRSVSIPVIGVKFSTYDIDVVGGVGMMIVITWLYFVISARYHAINRIHLEFERAIAKKFYNKASYMYHGIAHYFVFTDPDIKTSNHPLSVLSVRILLYAPAVVLFIVFAQDIINALFAPMNVIENANNAFWNGASLWERVEIIGKSTFGLIAALFCLHQCRNCARYNAETLNRLQIMRDKINSVEGLVM